jgi:hypothetical protein
LGGSADLTRQNFGDEPRGCFTHRVGRFLLHEVRALHGNDLLIGPRTAKVALRADREAARATHALETKARSAHVRFAASSRR